MTEKVILGIDEVGRGPWAGPLVVGAVILDTTVETLELTDSKRLSPKKRELLAPLIYEQSQAAATGWVSAQELDQYGLSASLKLATRRAVKQILATKTPFSEIIIDGTVNFLQGTPLADRVTTLKKADDLIKAVSAASIIAKVARDSYMIDLAAQYPEYGFESHVGYGTTRHQAALLQYGVCPEHRRSFRPIQKILGEAPEPLSKLRRDHPSKSTSPNSTTKGKTAENLVADYLVSQGHTIITQNFKTKTYEIDLISTKNDQIFFTEVKYRQDNHHGSALEQITPTKQQQMQYAAEKFLSTHQDLSGLQPQLAAAAVSGEPPTLETWFTLKI